MTLAPRFTAALLSLTLILVPAGASAQDAPPQPPERWRGVARDLLRELVEINTDAPSGSTTAAAEAMAAHARAAGFPEEDIFLGGSAPLRGNLVVRYRGRDPSLEPLLLLAHIDVVPADPADWNLDPFTFVEQDGWYYGRGTTDDKDEAAIHLANLIRLKEEGWVPDRDIIVALTADEEGGGNNGVSWLLANHRDLIDAGFALNEGGGGSWQDGRRLSNNVQASEKMYLSFTFEATNPGGHSSLPVRKNAIYDLSQALLAVADHAFPVRLNEVTRAYFGRTAEIVGGRDGDAMERILADPGDERAAAVLSEQPGYNSRLRTTCVATMLEGGHAPNALPQRATATVNCRLLPDEDPELVHTRLQELAGSEVTVTPQGRARPSPPSPLTPELMDAVEEVTGEMWPGVPVVPVMLTGATDGLMLRNAGIPTYGVSGLFGDVDDVRAHGQDERIRVDWFHEGQEFLYRLTKRLTRGGVS